MFGAVHTQNAKVRNRVCYSYTKCNVQKNTPLNSFVSSRISESRDTARRKQDDIRSLDAIQHHRRICKVKVITKKALRDVCESHLSQSEIIVQVVA